MVVQTLGVLAVVVVVVVLVLAVSVMVAGVGVGGVTGAGPLGAGLSDIFEIVLFRYVREKKKEKILDGLRLVYLTRKNCRYSSSFCSVFYNKFLLVELDPLTFLTSVPLRTSELTNFRTPTGQ